MDEVRQGVAVLRKVAAASQSAAPAFAAERKAQIVHVALETLVGCLALLASEGRRKALLTRVFEWILDVLECTRVAGVETELLLAKVARRYLERLAAESQQHSLAGMRLAWSLGEETARRQGLALFANLDTLCRLALVTHCCEVCQASLAVAEWPAKSAWAKASSNQPRRFAGVTGIAGCRWIWGGSWPMPAKSRAGTWGSSSSS